MEANRLIRASGFFVSAFTEASIAAVLFEIAYSQLVSLAGFSFIIALFVLSLALRAQTWKRLGVRSVSFIRRITWLLVLILGLALLVEFLVFAYSQTVLLPLQDYAGNPSLVLMAALWTVYSLLEVYFRRSAGNWRGYPIALSIASVVILDVSVFALSLSAYVLPAAMLVLAASSVVTGATFSEKLGTDGGTQGVYPGWANDLR